MGGGEEVLSMVRGSSDDSSGTELLAPQAVRVRIINRSRRCISTQIKELG
jgi:hypothetical protein